MGLPITLITHLFLVYKLTKLYDVTRVTTPLVTSVTTHVSSVFATLPEHSDVIVRAPNLGPPPSSLGTPSPNNHIGMLWKGREDGGDTGHHTHD